MSFEDQLEGLKGATTLYVGNLSFYTTEVQIHETFSRIGPVKRIIMGLNRESKAPCGFCFVEYYTYENACACLKYISGTMCDGQIIRCELDGGFKQGRQFGRGKSGGQIRDERKQDLQARAPSQPPPPPSRGRTVVVDRAATKDRKRDRWTDNTDQRPLDLRIESGLGSSRGGDSRPPAPGGPAPAPEGIDGEGAAAPAVAEAAAGDADTTANEEDDSAPAAKYRRRGDKEQDEEDA
jgi:hypothetical protein